MKKQGSRKSIRLDLPLALALLVATSNMVIAAVVRSKGGAQSLMKPSSTPRTPVANYDACKLCKDTYVSQKDATVRGATQLDNRVVRHLCAGCMTKITTKGLGKAKTDVATHSCDTCVPKGSSCCAPKS